jgi:prepilin peptidase CpaA
MLTQVPQWLVCTFAAAAAVYDYRTGLIPNRLIALGLVTIVIARAAIAAALSGSNGLTTSLLVCLLGLLACGLIPLAIYLCRGLGGGDVKLFAMCGAGLGPIVGLEAELYAFGLGALFALSRAAYEGALFGTLMGSASLLTNPLLPKRLQRAVAPSAQRQIRFGPAIAAGVVAALALHGSVS